MPINIHIEDNSNIATVRYDRENVEFIKYLTLNELQSIFKLTTTVSTPVLPIGTRKYFEKNNTILLWIETPPHKRPILAPAYFDRHIEIPLPVHVFIIKLRKQDVNQYTYCNMYVFAQKAFTTTQQETLYASPILNTSANGTICIGNINMPAIDHVSEAHMYINNFLGSKFTGGLGFHVANELGIKLFYQRISQMDTFPLDSLLRADNIHQNKWNSMIGEIQ